MNLICEAITQRSVIRFDYSGGSRDVEPFCHGTSRTGNELLRGYQVGGYSESGNPIGWKIFSVEQMGQIKILEKTFSGSRPQYNPNDSVMAMIHCRV